MSPCWDSVASRNITFQISQSYSTSQLNARHTRFLFRKSRNQLSSRRRAILLGFSLSFSKHTVVVPSFTSLLLPYNFSNPLVTSSYMTVLYNQATYSVVKAPIDSTCSLCMVERVTPCHLDAEAALMT